jgi:hypothetical protein
MVRPATILLGSLLLLSGCGTHATAPSATPSTNPSPNTVVPWRALPATRPVIPSRLIPPRPDPALAEQARRCRGSDVVFRWKGAGAAAGTMVQNVDVDLAPGHAPCAVSGRPSAVAHTVEGTAIPGHLQMFTVRSHAPVLLNRNRQALVQLTWPSACFSEHGGDASFTLGYGGRTWTQPVRDLSDTCHVGPPDRPLRTIGVSRFVPLHLRPARRASAYDGVRAQGPAQLVARADRPIDFVVTLVARRDVVLDPCPDYRLGVSPDRGQELALNCAAVPWRDTLGRPYLPAGRPVRFAMHVGATDGTVQKYWWGIVAPGSPPVLGGAVRLG